MADLNREREKKCFLGAGHLDIAAGHHAAGHIQTTTHFPTRIALESLPRKRGYELRCETGRGHVASESHDSAGGEHLTDAGFAMIANGEADEHLVRFNGHAVYRNAYRTVGILKIAAD